MSVAINGAIKRGALIVFEGCDRCGKTTQCKKLVEALQKDGVPVKGLRFPNRTTAVGQMVSSYLQKTEDLDDHAVHLLFSANRWECVKDIQSELNSGTTLIVDRYAFSGVAFTAAKPGFTLDWCKTADTGLPRPDRVIYLDISQEAASKRGDYGNERYEKADIQARVANNYRQLIADTSVDWTTVDADCTVDELFAKLMPIIKGVINEAQHKPLRKLWVDEQH